MSNVIDFNEFKTNRKFNSVKSKPLEPNGLKKEGYLFTVQGNRDRVNLLFYPERNEVHFEMFDLKTNTVFYRGVFDAYILGLIFTSIESLKDNEEWLF